MTRRGSEPVCHWCGRRIPAHDTVRYLTPAAPVPSDPPQPLGVRVCGPACPRRPETGDGELARVFVTAQRDPWRAG